MKARDEGSILPLTIFYGVLALVLVLLVTAATSLYLERKRLFTVADGASLVGAEAFELDRVTQTDGRFDAHLKSSDVATAVRGYLTGGGVTRFDRLTVDRAESSDGRSATVALSARWTPPVVSLLVPGGIRIAVTSTARSVFR
ncbi:hypothetical protein BH11ACT2_BH11ACT2_09830 [soil metagenome]